MTASRAPRTFVAVKTQPLEVEPRSLTRFILVAVPAATFLLVIPAVSGLAMEPFLLFAMYVVLLGGAMIVARGTGPGGVRRLFAGILHWRIGWRNWTLATVVLPITTLVVATVAGGYQHPADGWGPVMVQYLFATFVFGFLLMNAAEESVWQGLVQRNLTRRLGLIRAACLTAVPFAFLHVPLAYAAGGTTRESLISVGVTLAVAPLMRYAVGKVDASTGGSLLAAGVFHASFNASGQLPVVGVWWCYCLALALIVAAFLIKDALRSRRI